MIQYKKICNFRIIELKLNLNLLIQAIGNAPLIILSLIFQEELKKLFEKYKLF